MRHMACLPARKRPAIALLPAVFVIAAVLPIQAAPAHTPGTAGQLNRLFHRFARAHPSFPGVEVAVRTPKLSWAGAAGFADRATRKPLSADADFRIASVTKTFTAAAILRLVENGKVSLDDPIARYLSPATVALLRGGGYDTDAIRVRNLLQHTSGLYDYAEDPAFQTFVVSHPHHRWTRAEQIRFAMTHGRPLFPPGTDFHYSDTGYILLGEILERQTGHSLAAAYRTLLSFRRLGLHQTYLETLEPTPTRGHTTRSPISSARPTQRGSIPRSTSTAAAASSPPSAIWSASTERSLAARCSRTPPRLRPCSANPARPDPRTWAWGSSPRRSDTPPAGTTTASGAPPSFTAPAPT